MYTRAGPLLVAQGLNDPLGGGISRTRFALYPEAHPAGPGPAGATLVPLAAGHCPHHEAPGPVAAAVRAFLASPPVRRRAAAAAAAAAGSPGAAAPAVGAAARG